MPLLDLTHDIGIPLFYTECHRSSATGQPHAEKQSVSCEKRLSYKITAGMNGRDERHTARQPERKGMAGNLC